MYSMPRIIQNRSITPEDPMKPKKIYRCHVCKRVHPLRSCSRFLNMDVHQRRKVVHRFKYCLNCLAHKHSRGKCLSRSGCHICKRQHHTLLHHRGSQQYSRSEHASTSHSTHAMLPHQRITVLPTAIIKIAWKNRLYPVRALIDTGSAVSRIAKATVTKHHLLTSRMGESEMCQIVFRAHSGNTTKISMCARVDNRISMVTPISTLSMAFKEKFLNLVLADPDFLESNPISIVLGADIYPKLILSGVIPTGEGSLMAQNSTLGWLVSGTCAA